MIKENDDRFDEETADLVSAYLHRDDAPVSEHPTTEVLVAYQERRLAEAAAGQVRRHLVSCEACAREFLALDEIDLDSADFELFPAASETANAWEEFQRTLDAAAPADKAHEQETSGVESVPQKEKTVRRHRASRRATQYVAFAASLLLAVWIGHRTAESPAVGSPAVDAPKTVSNPLLVDLLPLGTDPIRDAVIVEEIVLPSGMDSLALRLNLGDQTSYEEYRIEIADETGSVHLLREDHERQPAGQFLVLASREELFGESYSLKLSGLNSDGEKVLAEYAFRLKNAE